MLGEDGWEQVVDWIAAQGFERLAAAGMLAVVWVLPRPRAAFFDAARVLAQVRHPLFNTFTDAQAAYDWLHRWPHASQQQGELSCCCFLRSS